MDAFAEGYAFFAKNAGTYSAAEISGTYVGDIEAEINKFAELLNEKFNGNHADINQLKGNLAEFWHAGTFNIKSIVKGASKKEHGEYIPRAVVLESNKYGSVDVQVDSKINVGSKYYKTAAETLKQQAKNARESYHKYVSDGGKATFDEYRKERGITDPNAPVYAGQVRLVPKEQLVEIKALLEKKIAHEKQIRPEQIPRYQDTLDMIKDRIEGEKGVESVPLDTADAKEIARLAKENGVSEDKLREMGLSTEELIDFNDVMRESFKAGLTAATISMVLRVAPEIYKALSFLIQTGEVDAEQFKGIGFAALTGASAGFIRGTVSAALTTACKSGLLGQSLKSIDPSVIGAVTAIAVSTMKNAFNVVQGTMAERDLANELVQEMFVTTCSLVLGGAAQTFIQIPVLGFMLGSFVGSLVGSFTYKAGYNALLSLCVDTGFTMFGLVEQNYVLPDEVLEIIGAEVFEYEHMDFSTFGFEEFQFEEFSFEQFEPEGLSISVLRRGVISISTIGYIS